MKEFYAEECGEDYGTLCYQEQTRRSVTKDMLEEILNLEISKFEIDFEEDVIEYTYNEDNADFTKEISINDFYKACYELKEYNE